jgi:hypothetical protein
MFWSTGCSWLSLALLKHLNELNNINIQEIIYMRACTVTHRQIFLVLSKLRSVNTFYQEAVYVYITFILSKTYCKILCFMCKQDKNHRIYCKSHRPIWNKINNGWHNPNFKYWKGLTHIPLFSILLFFCKGRHLPLVSVSLSLCILMFL